jgi:hypothetical protein
MLWLAICAVDHCLCRYVSLTLAAVHPRCGETKHCYPGRDVPERDVGKAMLQSDLRTCEHVECSVSVL